MKNARQFILVFSVGLISFLTMILFNNCSAYVKSAETFSSQDPLSSETPTADVPAPQQPQPPITGPTQPAPAPIVPITTTNNPAWMVGKSLNEWIEIPNTSGAGGSAIIAFCGLALRELTSELIIGAAGGHGDSDDNRVVSLILAADQPKWVTRIGPSPFGERDVSHYKDGTPSSRHTYQNTYYIESLDRLFLMGARYVYGMALSYPTVDAFSFKTNQWDPPNTWAPVPQGGGYGSVKIPGTDDVYTENFFKWSASAATAAYKAGNPAASHVWSKPVTVRTNAIVRFPLAYDKKRHQLFNLQYGDGQGYDIPTIHASKVDLASGVQSDITIKPSAAYDIFKAEGPIYSAMDYDPENDRYLYYSGIGNAAGRVYVIKPSSTSSEWEMSLFQTIANSPKPPPTPGSGINSNFKYVPALKGFVLLPGTHNSNLFFIKTAQ